MFLWIVVARGGEQGKALWTLDLSFFWSSLNNNSGARWVVINLPLPQPEACVSLSVILFSLLSLQREMAVLLKLVIAEDILLILLCSWDYIFVLPMYLFLQMIVEFHSRKDTSSVFNLGSAFSKCGRGPRRYF